MNLGSGVSSEIAAAVLITAISLSIIAAFSTVYMDRLSSALKEVEIIASRAEYRLSIVDCFFNASTATVVAAVYSDIDMEVAAAYVNASLIDPSHISGAVAGGEISVLSIDVSTLNISAGYISVKLALYSEHTGYRYLSCGVAG